MHVKMLVEVEYIKLMTLKCILFVYHMRVEERKQGDCESYFVLNFHFITV